METYRYVILDIIVHDPSRDQQPCESEDSCIIHFESLKITIKNKQLNKRKCGLLSSTYYDKCILIGVILQSVGQALLLFSRILQVLHTVKTFTPCCCNV